MTAIESRRHEEYLQPFATNIGTPTLPAMTRTWREILTAAVPFSLNSLRKSLNVILAFATRSRGTTEAAPSARETSRSVMQKRFLEAQLALGERMLAAGIDDGTLRDRIARLDEQISRVETTDASLEMLQRERTRLLRLLADCALEDDAPLPGADAEYATAKNARAMYHQLEWTNAREMHSQC